MSKFRTHISCPIDMTNYFSVITPVNNTGIIFKTSGHCDYNLAHGLCTQIPWWMSLWLQVRKCLHRINTMKRGTWACVFVHAGYWKFWTKISRVNLPLKKKSRCILHEILFYRAKMSFFWRHISCQMIVWNFIQFPRLSVKFGISKGYPAILMCWGLFSRNLTMRAKRVRDKVTEK